MDRKVIVEQLLREMAQEMPVLLRALPDDALWRTMAMGLVADEDVDVLSARLAGGDPAMPGAPDWREVYGELREMVNEWPISEAAFVIP